VGQKKLFRFAQISSFPNVYEYPEKMQGKWKDHFNNSNAIQLELACGRGEYTVGLASIYPSKNFIGVDIKGNRMYIGAKYSIDNKLENAAFLRTQIEMLPDYFDQGEVDEIWIIFPDPQLRVSKAKKRLTHPRFLRLYQKILKKGGLIHLKTDSPDLYNFTKHVISMYGLSLVEDLDDISVSEKPELKIKTHYEGLDIAKSNTIHFLTFSLPEVLPDLDEQLQEDLRVIENKSSMIHGQS